LIASDFRSDDVLGDVFKFIGDTLAVGTVGLGDERAFVDKSIDVTFVM